MAVLQTISELTLVGVADRGIPNKERIVLRPTESVDLSAFALIAVALREGAAYPMPDTFLWLGNIRIAPPSWIYVYTGPGTYALSKITSTQHPVHVYHWGRKTVLFHQAHVHPALLRLGAIGYGGSAQTNPPMSEAEVSDLMRALLASSGPLPTPATAIGPPPPKPALPSKK